MTHETGGAKPSGSQTRAPSWRAKFLHTLAATSNVTASAAEANIGLSHIYRVKRSDREFAQQWLVALCEGYDSLEIELLGRLREGEQKGSSVKHDNATALRLLLAHRESRARYQAAQDNVSAADVRASIDAKLALLRERVMAREADCEAADAA